MSSSSLIGGRSLRGRGLPQARIYKKLYIVKNKMTIKTYYIVEYYKHVQVCA